MRDGATNSYRKKPVVIQAEQYIASSDRLPFEEQDVLQYDEDARCQYIQTLESNRHVVSDGDWIIRGVKGEFYACKPDIFAMTYEPASTASEKLPTVRSVRCTEQCQEAVKALTPTVEQFIKASAKLNASAENDEQAFLSATRLNESAAPQGGLTNCRAPASAASDDASTTGAAPAVAAPNDKSPRYSVRRDEDGYPYFTDGERNISLEEIAIKLNATPSAIATPNAVIEECVRLRNALVEVRDELEPEHLAGADDHHLGTHIEHAYMVAEAAVKNAPDPWKLK